MTLQDLLDHEAKRPQLPRPVPQAGTPEWSAWRKAWDEWQGQKEALERKHELEGFRMIFERTAPAVLPKSDYIYREPIKRRRKAA